jgi:hypothetical protein
LVNNGQKYGCNYAPFVLVCRLFDPNSEEFAMSRIDEETAGDPWDAFDLCDEDLESLPEPGDFWEELDDDCDSIG